MGIMLGNLSVDEMEKRMKIEVTDDERQMLNDSRQEIVNDTPLGEGKWHCFDIPFMMMCDTEQTAKKFYTMFKKYPIKGTFQVGWER